MRRKTTKGYYVDGQFVRLGSEADQAAAAESEDGVRPSRTARKQASTRLQTIGEQLLTLRPEQLAGLPLPEKLKVAVLDARKLSKFGAQRRQRQLIGKLMRQLEPEEVEKISVAVGGRAGGVR